ncbi:MAG: hypothetical protein ACC645_17775, partial [Pirellulales bacterium]
MAISSILTRKRSRPRPWRVACVVLTVAAATAAGADGTWDRPGDGVWTNPTSWLGGVPNGVGETAFFGPDAPSRPSAVIQLNESITVGTIDDANANQIRLTGPGPLVFDAVGLGTPVTIDLRQNGGELDLRTPIVLIDDPLTVRTVDASEIIFSGLFQGGADDLTKEGAGLLSIDEATDDWTGRLLVAEGTVEIRDSSGLGAGSGTLADGTIVSVDGTLAIARNVTIVDERVRLDGAAISGGQSGSAAFNGPLELSADSRATNQGAEATLNLGGTIEGPGGLNVDRGIVELRGEIQFGGQLTVAGATVGIRSAAAHGGSRVGPGGVMKVRSSGSLVDAGMVTVDAGGELRIVAPAGSDPSTSSVSPASILLEEGTLTLARIDFSPSGLLASASQGGVLLLEKLPTYTAGGTDMIDFDAIGGRDLRLGAKTDATLPAGVALLPESATTTLRFGGGPA